MSRINELDKLQIYSDTVKLCESLFNNNFQTDPAEAIREIYEALKKLKEN